MAVTRTRVTESVTESQSKSANGASVTCDTEGTCCPCDACDGCDSQKPLRTGAGTRRRVRASLMPVGYVGLTSVREALDICQRETGTAVTI